MATSSVSSTIASSVSSAITSSVTSALSHTSSVTSAVSSTSNAPAATTTAGSPSSSGPQSSPLLFFVALGFGVVFTNLWIIVGVKYCFRYSARNRRPHDENGDPIDLGAMPRQRRRREKKLMTMEEVNDRFPIMKYKAWTASRAEQGLSTEGGVNPNASRPPSIKHETGTLEDPRGSSDHSDRPGTSASTRHEATETPAEHTTDANATLELEPERQGSHLQEVKTTASTQRTEDEEEEEAIQTAVPTEMMTNPGDSCAICIDTLEEDDDVRGLTCGHAFHASCVDPWLTSRRACCPLCKADYYIPKPRPEGDQSADLERGLGMGRRSTGQAPQAPLSPAVALLGSRWFRGTQQQHRHRHHHHHHNAHVQPTHAAPRFPMFGRRGRQTQQQHGAQNSSNPSASQVTASTEPTSGSWASRVRPPMPALRLPRAPWRRANGNENTESNPTATTTNV